MSRDAGGVGTHDDAFNTIYNRVLIGWILHHPAEVLSKPTAGDDVKYYCVCVQQPLSCNAGSSPPPELHPPAAPPHPHLQSRHITQATTFKLGLFLNNYRALAAATLQTGCLRFNKVPISP